MHSLHPQARTTPAVRQEIARSREPTGVLAQRFSVSTETIRKWRKRGVQDCQDHSSRPHKLPWKATEEERAIVCALRQATGFPLDDLTFIVTHFLPHLNRDAVYRILKAEGLGRLPPAPQRQRRSGTFKDYDLGFIHIDIKHLPKLRTANGESRKRFLYVAIDRCSRWVHLAVYDDELATSAIAFLKEAVRAFPFKVTHVLTDRGSCFTADGFEDACRKLKLEHRKTRPYTPQTNGLVERFNGRVQREVLGITIYSHRDLEMLLNGFNQAYNRRRQRVLKGRSPEQVVQSRLAAEPKLANRRFKPPDADALPPALRVVAHAKEVSHPDNYEAALCRRGDLTVWVTAEAIEAWTPTNTGRRGRPQRYSEMVVETGLMLRLAFGRPWRQTEGMLASILRLLDVNLPVPDHTTFSRRSVDLSVAKAVRAATGPVNVVIDSTGLKVFGAAEWQREKHGGKGHRTWRKLHLAADPDTSEILASELTTTEDGDASQVGPLLDQIPGPIASVTADGAYDGDPVYRIISQRHPVAAVIIPPRSTAVTSDTAETAPTQRDRHLRMIQERGRRGWQKAVNYGRRSLGEVAMMRYKTLIGRRLHARTLPTQKTEAAIGCKVLNVMAHLGMPVSQRIT